MHTVLKFKQNNIQINLLGGSNVGLSSTVEWLTHFLCIWEILVYKLGPMTGCPG